MALLPHPSLTETLGYFSRYDYPLTSDELWFWQHGSQYSKSEIRKLSKNLKLENENYDLRNQRELISKQKWLIANRVGDQLSRIPFVQAIFVTGSLAMNNTDSDADVDLMIITSPNTLWLTRLLVFLNLKSLRRRPGVVSSPDHICDNLYLDTNNLKLKTKNLRVAHELLQTKCIFARSNVHYQFLMANPWVSEYLPVAYHEILKRTPPKFKYQKSGIYTFLWPLNLVLFLLQYLYMLPRLTTERVTPGSAFFHPATKV